MKSLFAIAALSAAVFAGAAQAEDAKIETGVLKCSMTDRTNLVVYSTTSFNCVFDRSGPNEEYTGKVKAVGLDLTLKKDENLVWAVFAPTGSADRDGQLAGDYYGASASVAIGAGVGGKVLVGGFDESIALQPLSATGQKGVGASLGIEGLELKAK